ncbi:MAG: dihydrolipoyl dehydrogenase [Stygiobacter sp. RIFOXYA12_FULL_38_9]|nr:MAG: dihydrolipoyl dehydrogenase [Stygiobacter sp. RIFOXYA12_FULL_38_9]OGV06317.1 MAG: dihydrolipoyl dehydrogenase [Stygiobacter sp. RIFOXYB2_FULL_37_11]OGV11073.1 MAG: dihydrolipoyl dehydrogenase [Stygiobacter sp. RIFOXYA2_FULL_38_8]OGV16068.1 MAG: dihydrolipoyl dehydrogenase [Stygiobacter sp. RIFOXYC2_FULL_38_25]OGV80545.1 MAG: dihydrolipoyl dehydrogenase [Stygiobacter sp. GWF2_38_21]
MKKSFDLAVLGGGPGGYVAAIRAAQLGFNTVVIDKENLGGICLNWGCIPTKALLKSAEVYDMMKNHSEDYGIKVDGLSFDFNKIISRSRGISDRITKNVEMLIKKNKIERIRGFGKFVSKNEIEIFDTDGKKFDSVIADKIIIATGARPRIFPTIPVDRKNIITSTEAMNLPKQPKDLIVIGAGAIGVEFAYFYSVLGTKVTIVEMLDNLLPIEDKEVSETLEKSFKKRGIEIYTKTKVENAVVKDDYVIVNVEKDGKKIELKAEKVLSAIGVTGNVEGFGLQEFGIEIERGHIKVDKQNYQTNVPNIFAIGDVIGAPWLAHVASAEGIHCVEKMKGLHANPIDYNTIPGCTYCHPQVASVGMTEKKAKEEGREIKIGKFPFMASGKAFAAGERDGFVKLIFDAKYGELLGAHIIGPEATELISEITLAKSMEATYETIVKTVHAHPTLAESIMEAAANAYGKSIHI